MKFNQAFFDKIDQIEIDISNNIDFKTIINELDIEISSIKDFKFSNDKSEIEKIFELRNTKFDLLKTVMIL